MSLLTLITYVAIGIVVYTVCFLGLLMTIAVRSEDGMMTFSTKSWHYWLATKTGESPAPRTLCAYFWAIQETIIVSLAILFAVSFVAWFISAPIIWLFTGLVNGKLAVFSLLVSITLGSFWAYFTYYLEPNVEKKNYLEIYGPEKYAQKYGPMPTKKVNFLHALIKAKKERVCPLIKFDDKD